MVSLHSANPPDVIAAQPTPRVRDFWGTALWGVLIFVALFVGQVTVVGVFVYVRGGPVDISATLRDVAASGLAISLSVIAGLPAVLLALWLAIRPTGTPFTEYLAMRWTSWRYVIVGAAGLALLVLGWDQLSRATGHDVSPGFMVDVLKSARGDDALWLLVLALCVAAPVSEELFARGFLYRGWSESSVKVPGAIVLSSLVWTGLHLQYDWFFFGEVFCIGLWLGYMRYRSNSTWLTIVLHGFNNLGALAQTIWLAGQS
jgi:uncharacterized protein